MNYFKKLASSLLVAAAIGGAVSSAQAATFIGDRTDFRDETIYFAMTTRFYDGDEKNNVCTWDKQDQQISTKDPAWRGDFAGLIEKLDYIKALGFTAIWITPIVQNGSGIDYHGYHAMDFSKVDLRYESRKEWGCEKDVKFQDLIDAAHKKGIKIVLDVVLQHTGNFGEANLNPLFTRNQNIRNQAHIEYSMKPGDRLGSDYWKLPVDKQYPARWIYFKNPQYESKNYYHHYGTGWNWDLPNRWWGQIAGDCVDLNTENDAVAQYIVECYGKFIEMGVDAFRIDTSGHISPLTFNKQFIPQFQALGEKYKSKRLNQAPFYMFGEVCQRFQGTVVYRDQPNLSSYFYTWKSDQSLLDQFDGNPEWWAKQNLPEGHDTPVGPMAVCEKDTKDKPRSTNVLLQNGQWHEPDYSQASGLNVIDFPVHYSFKSVADVQQYYRQDNYYNDASFNVVYVDSHDYGPGPNDGIRFNGGTAQWAENLSWMFTFRGIPCLYYGSEVEFMAGKTIDDGMQTALNQTGRAYFGHYLEGNVNATDFAQYTADGQVAKTLNGDLAHHIQQLNKIRAAVPALRKGQYTFDGCSAKGGWAFKRAYKNESYVLVAVNGGATFSNVPAGTYTDIVTGKTYQGGGTITVDAPTNKGQLRVLVKDWKGGKIVDDGKFIYSSSAVSKGGNPTATDPGAKFFYTKEDAVDDSAGVIFTPAGGSFMTETLTVSASLSASSTTGWYQVAGQQKVTLTPGKASSFTIGKGVSYGETISVSYEAKTAAGETASGTVTYKKVDPNATITINVTGMNGANISGANMYVWNAAGTLNGAWPGTKLGNAKQIDGRTFYSATFDATEVNVIFNQNGQTEDILGITEDTYFEYDGGSQYKKITVVEGPKAPVVRANPASGTTFSSPIDVTLSVTPATDIYYTLDGKQASASSTRYTGPIHLTKTTTINVYAKNEVGETRTAFTYTYSDAPVSNDMYAYFDASDVNWGSVYAYCWDDNNKEANSYSGAWPGKQLTDKMTYQGRSLYIYKFTPKGDLANCKIIFNNGSGGNGNQTADFDFKHQGIYRFDGFDQEMVSTAAPVVVSAYEIGVVNGALVIISDVETNVAIYGVDGTMIIRHISEGVNVIDDLKKGIYIVNGKKVML